MRTIKSIKMRKKGDLTNNILSLVVVALGIVILLFGFLRLLENARDDETRNVQRTLDGIVEKIKLLEDGQSNKFLIQGFPGANNWFLVGWSGNEPSRPEKCSFESCLCVCKGSANGADCQSNGICREVNYNTLDIFSLKQGPVGSILGVTNSANKERFDFLDVQQREDFIEDKRINLAENLIQIKIFKEKDKLIIGYYNPDVSGLSRGASAGTH